MLKAKSYASSLNNKINKAKVIANICSIQNRDFSVIASNCTGTLPYRFLKSRYNTPTANLLFMAPCYLKFIKNLEYYLSIPMVFYTTSRYAYAEKIRAAHQHYYPIGTLDDIEVHFMHYTTASDAKAKWNKRRQRVNYDNLIFAFTDKDLCTPEHLYEFDAIDHPHKFVLTANYWPDIKCAIQVPHFAGQREIGDCYTHYEHLKHIDFRSLVDHPVPREQPQPSLYASQ